MIKQGALSKEILTEMFHKIDKLFNFEIYIIITLKTGQLL